MYRYEPRREFSKRMPWDRKRPRSFEMKLANMGSFDYVVVRSADDNSAQDDWEITVNARAQPRDYCWAISIAWRTWPFVFFNAAAACDFVTRAASITTATGVRLPLALSARAAVG